MTFNVQFNKVGEPNHCYAYEIMHKPTGKVYVGISAPNKEMPHGYWGSACGDCNVLFHRETILKNLNDYQKIILTYFKNWDEAGIYEKNSLIPNYIKEYGDLCLNGNIGGHFTLVQLSAAGQKGGKIAGPMSKGKIYIHKDGEMTTIHKDQLDEMIAQGWTQGKTEEYCETQREAQTKPEVNNSRIEKLAGKKKSDEHIENMKIAFNTPEQKKIRSKNFSGDKNPTKRPEVREIISQKNIERFSDPKEKQRTADLTKLAMQRPDVKSKQLKNQATAIANRTEEQKALASINPSVVSNNHAASGLKYKNFPIPNTQQINDFVNLFNKTFICLNKDT